jgi:hypothetical protein
MVNPAQATRMHTQPITISVANHMLQIFIYSHRMRVRTLLGSTEGPFRKDDSETALLPGA